VRRELWLTQARPEQLEPPGEWRVWYLRGGRGAGKSKTGSSTLAHWIASEEPGEWGILAPTFADAKRCVEQKSSGLLAALGAAVRSWNRSEGVIYVEGGAEVYVDGADDGALRIQGRNLRGAWCDEVGLWRDWDRAWNESLQMAVRFEPGRIIATGTPKMAHPLIAHLLRHPTSCTR
jgi:phage terminase large subunit-like protein